MSSEPLPVPVGEPRTRMPLHHRRVLEIIRRDPGLCIQELADRLGLSRSATVHHVRRLRRNGMVQITRQGRRAAHFVSQDMLNQNEQTLLSLLRQHTARRILSELRRQPSITWNELARRLKIGAHAVRWHVARLAREGVVEVRRQLSGRGHWVFVAPELDHHLSAAEPAEPAPSPEPSPSPPTASPSETVPPEVFLPER